MTKSDDIRALARRGVGTADIASQLGIRYQHAYNVLKQSGLLAGGIASTRAVPSGKPPLPVSGLLQSGFELSGRWVLTKDGEIAVQGKLPKDVGVYVFAMNGVAMYVGVATMGLASRLYFYARPGQSQLTNIRVNAILKEALRKSVVEIYTARPPDLEWNGLPVHGSAGLELGLIKRYALPWNKRSAG